jgi:hypothetical protein
MEHLHGDTHDDELNKPMLWLAGFFVVMFAVAFVFATIGKNPQQMAINERSMTSGDVLIPPITQPATPTPTTTGQGQSP